MSDTPEAARDRQNSERQPLVSVLIRSMQRACLADALASVARQSWPNTEIIVINARGGEHPDLGQTCGPFPLRLENQDGLAMDRPAAANLGLCSARGEWLIFLDDDDHFDVNHLARLREALDDAPAALAAYTGVRLADADGGSKGVLDEPYNSMRLWVTNFLPIHAVMFARRLVEEGLRFDESLPVYEDWDFWRQVSLRQPLLHVPGVSATYRLVGHSGLTARADDRVTAEGRQRFYEKWLPSFDADELNRLSTAAERWRGVAADADQTKLRAAMAAMAAVEAALTRAHAVIGVKDRELTNAGVYAEGLAHQLRDAQRELGKTAQAYRQMEGSLSWRATAPLRAVRSAMSQARPNALLARLLLALPVSAGRRQDLKVRLATSRFGPQLLRWLATARTGAASAGSPADPRARIAPPLDKEAVRADAEAQLSQFLSSDQRLDLARADGPAKVSVVVVLYNQAGLSLMCLQALAASRGVTLETLVVDNASTDRVPDLFDRIDGATLMLQSENLGFLRAVNLAAAQARGDYLLLLNNDAVVETDTLAHAVARLAQSPDVGAVGGPIMLWDGRLQEAGSIIWRDGSCQGYGRGDWPDSPPYTYVRDVDYCSGAFLMLRRSLFEQLGRFDAAYAPAYYEESDLCVRLWEAGHRIVYDPKVRVKHFEFASDEGSGRAIALQTRNRALFSERHASFLARQHAPAAAAVFLARQRLPNGAHRVLFIDDRVPLPWLGRGYPRAASFVAAICTGGDFVTHYPLLFPHADPADVAQALPPTCEVMLNHGLAGLAEFLAERQGYYDTLIVSRPHNMTVLSRIRDKQPQLFSGLRVIYDAEALFSLRDIARATVQGAPLSTAQQQTLIQQELTLVRGADVVLAVTESEAAHYRAAGFGDVQVLGHALQPKANTVGFAPRTGFLFVGAIESDDSPNGDSLLWFVREVWPLIEAELGSAARLDIVGPCDSATVRALAGRNIGVHGMVAHLEPWLTGARVFLAPTRFAAGLPHKAHEAAAAGLPIVASTLIANQLGWEAWLPHADSPAEMARLGVALHQSAARWVEQRDLGLAAVARDCDPARFNRAVQGLFGPRR